GTVCVVGKMRDLILQLSKSSIYSTKPRICATGIEKAEEWMWLESAGIAYFQGPLFSGYSDDGLPFVSWPDPVEI
ncbi:hypothetical protein POX44_26250, partial [Klebsiella quasipneumoniae]